MLALPAFTPARFAPDALPLDRVLCCDALALMDALPPQSVDAIITDLPYGTTACSWDEIIPFEPMWERVRRVLKPRGVFVTTASQPFTSKLVMSNLAWFRCEWIWKKSQGTGYLNANRQPMKNHESVLVFAEGSHNYSPQMRAGVAYRATSGAVGGFIRDKTVGGYLTISSGDRFPLSVIDFNSDTSQTVHPTQKPVALYRYLIRTYTRPGDVVLDFCAGSGTTALAAREEQRHFIAGDTSAEYVAIANRRLAQPYTLPMFSDSATDESESA